MQAEYYAEIIRNFTTPLTPCPTAMQPRLVSLPDVAAVIFDIYGTLFISGAGDIGIQKNEQSANAKAFALACREIGLPLNNEAEACRGINLFKEKISKIHEGRTAVAYPEIVVESVWQEVLHQLQKETLIPESGTLSDERCRELAVRYEVRINPVWPMPHLATVLNELSQHVYMGIVSNAQFFTPLLFDALLRKPVEAFGFRPYLTSWSFEKGVAKPSVQMFSDILKQLKENHKLMPEQVLYVGNDMLNDVYTAAENGCKTALFAGDARSLRLREGCAETETLEPQAIITDLRQLFDILFMS